MAVRAFVYIAPCVRAAVFDPHAAFFNTIPYHFFAIHAYGTRINGTEGNALFFKGLHALKVKVNEGGNVFLTAEKIGGEVIVGRIQQQLTDPVVRQESLHGHDRMHETEGIVHGSRIKEREDGKVILGVRSSQQVKIITVVIAVSGGIPSAVAVRL